MWRNPMALRKGVGATSRLRSRFRTNDEGLGSAGGVLEPLATLGIIVLYLWRIAGWSDDADENAVETSRMTILPSGHK